MTGRTKIDKRSDKMKVMMSNLITKLITEQGYDNTPQNRGIFRQQISFYIQKLSGINMMFFMNNVGFTNDVHDTLESFANDPETTYSNIMNVVKQNPDDFKGSMKKEFLFQYDHGYIIRDADKQQFVTIDCNFNIDYVDTQMDATIIPEMGDNGITYQWIQKTLGIENPILIGINDKHVCQCFRPIG